MVRVAQIVETTAEPVTTYTWTADMPIWVQIGDGVFIGIEPHSTSWLTSGTTNPWTPADPPLGPASRRAWRGADAEDRLSGHSSLCGNF